MTLFSTLKKSAGLAAIAVATLAFNADALAHGVTKPSHGGVVQMSGETLFELLVEPTGTSLFIVDEDDEVASSGFDAKLIVTAKGARTEVAMKPAAGNKFEAKGTKIAAGSKVAVLLTNKTSMAKTSAEFTVR